MSSLVLERPDDLAGYLELRNWLDSLRERGKVSEWGEAMRWYAQNDLFFFVNEVMTDGKQRHSHFPHTFYWHPKYIQYTRDIEWQAANGGGVDASARGQGKSTLRTKALSIQLMCKHPDIAICIFSFEKPAAKKHFKTIMEELEQNKLLYALFPEIFFENPKDAAINGLTVWSKTDGIQIKRTIIRKEPTLTYDTFSAQTGGRFDVLHYDDVESDEIVESKIYLSQLHDTYDSSIHVLTPVAIDVPILMVTNTIYSNAGLVKRLVNKFKQNGSDPRKVVLNKAEDMSVEGDGPLGGTPVYPYTADILQKFYDEPRDKEKYGLQYMGDPIITAERTFKRDWLFHYPGDPRLWGKNKAIYICIDPSKGVEDPMAIFVWALGEDKKYSWVDGSLKKLDPAHTSFYDEIYMIARKWADLGRLVEIRIEQYGNAMYVERVDAELKNRGFFIPVVKIADIKNQWSRRTTPWSGKYDRIYARWSGPAQKGEILFPKPVSEGGPGIIRPDENGKLRDLVDMFIQDEWLKFPKPFTDNMLDAGSFIFEKNVKDVKNNSIDRELQFPSIHSKKRKKTRAEHSFMSAG